MGEAAITFQLFLKTILRLVKYCAVLAVVFRTADCQAVKVTLCLPL